MQTEEGFYQAATYITEEAQYRDNDSDSGCSRPRPSAQNNLHYRLLNSSHLINHRTRMQWMLQLHKQHGLSIVYNNVRRDMVSGLADSGLHFDSCFEGGNLDVVVKLSHKEFQLYMRPDTNTLGHFQWFDFKVRCFKRSKTVLFHVSNFNKSELLYREGLRPYFQSSKSTNQEWQQLPGDDTTFQENPDGTVRLSFSYTFLHNYEEVEFSTQPPYRYARLSELLLELHLSGTLCDSLLKLKIPKLTIGSRDPSKLSAVVLVVGRQHPGESVGSWMMQGFLRESVKSSKDSNVLWVVVPMLNVDGVVLGNNRTGLLGYDLNRLYNEDDTAVRAKSTHVVEVKYLMELVKRLKKKYGKLFQLFLDFHGHSARKNVFAYGPPFDSSAEQYAEARLLPKLIADRTPLFRADQSSYHIPTNKLSTARAVMFNKFKIPFCYTVEASYGLGDGGLRLSTNHHMEVGKAIAQAAEQFCQYLKSKQSSGTDKVKQYEHIIEQIKQHAVEQHRGSDTEKVSDSEDSSYDGSEEDLKQEQRKGIYENLVSETKHEQEHKKNLDSSKERNAILSRRNNPTTIEHITSKELKQQDIHPKGQTFISRIAFRKEFRFRRVNDARNQLYNLYSYEPQLNQQFPLNVGGSSIPDPDSQPNKSKLLNLSTGQVQTLKNLPPLRAPDSRRLAALSQRRLQTENQMHYLQKPRPERRKKLSASLLTEQVQPPDQALDISSTIRRYNQRDKQAYLRDLLKNKKNKVGTKLLIINQM